MSVFVYLFVCLKGALSLQVPALPAYLEMVGRVCSPTGQAAYCAVTFMGALQYATERLAGPRQQLQSDRPPQRAWHFWLGC